MAASVFLNEVVPEEGEGDWKAFVCAQQKLLETILHNVESILQKVTVVQTELQADGSPYGASAHDFYFATQQHTPTFPMSPPQKWPSQGSSPDYATAESTVVPRQSPSRKNGIVAADAVSQHAAAKDGGVAGTDVTATWVSFVDSLPLGRKQSLKKNQEKQAGAARPPELASIKSAESMKDPAEEHQGAEKNVDSDEDPDEDEEAFDPRPVARRRSLGERFQRKAPHMVKALEHALGMHAEPELERSSAKEFREPFCGLEFSKTLLDVISCCLIISHLVYVGIEVETSVKHAKRGAAEPRWIFVGDLTFAALFAAELIVRFLLERSEFCTGADRMWNLFDLLVLSVQAVETVFTIFRVSFLRVIRVLRVLRAARVLRTVKYCPELRIMVISIISTLPSLFWAFALMFLFLYVAGIGFMQIAEYHIRDDAQALDRDNENYQDLLEYFGSLRACTVTLFMAISGGDDWARFSEPLRHYSEAYTFVFIIYVSFMLFGVLNVLTAIFVESASHIAAIDQDVAIQEQLRKDRSTIDRIKQMFYEADADNSGLLSLDELETLLVDPKYIWAMRLIGVDVSEARGLFLLLDINESNAVSIDEFVTGMMRLKGQAKGVDVATLIYENKRMYSHFQAAFERVAHHIDGFDHTAQKLLATAMGGRRRHRVGTHEHGHGRTPSPAQSMNSVGKSKLLSAMPPIQGSSDHLAVI
mmetsp:Transcript_68941/g.165453  ORF Transcript_68941/g.165453 Transcript_68941/m.165453 type:complete len:702 (-) Transcript_68941:64-2169(-)|eukprot:CAMPEP_0178383062 /NCGR_PEP_ID=MMETSP0689_2-20121128/6810_1 /TAXON_ID=160604 /ORGANISM="Amphidinium massartii, Strain CS-259" /LENGTH=701 /DNA_ID=CAMNT_0020003275 /DNA_START=37 /DNA_END=2142 /DNA_ORIENTATION=+